MQFSRAGEALVVRLKGSLSAADADHAREVLWAALRDGGRAKLVAVDLWDCVSIDTLGMAVLGDMAAEAPILLFGATGLLAAQLQLMEIPEGVRIVGHGAATSFLRGRRRRARERRGHPRVSVVLPAVLELEDGAGGFVDVFARTRDVSETGLGIALGALPAGTSPAWEPKDDLPVRVRVPSLFDDASVSGRTVRHARDPGGTLGIALQRLTDDQRSRIRSFVSRALGP
jgi:hypothetical protein